MDEKQKQLEKLQFLLNTLLNSSDELTQLIHTLHEHGFHIVLELAAFYDQECDHNRNNKPKIDVRDKQFKDFMRNIGMEEK